MKKIMDGLTPFIIVRLIALFITTYVPDLTLWLPKQLYPKSFP